MMQYQINIIDTDADMNKVRTACADLLHVNQTSDSFHADGSSSGESNAIYIDTDKATVSEAVKRINALGYSTDEEEDGE